MTRKYDASRREEAAQRTREAILDAAFKLHGLGIIDYDSLADEANVSVPTIRKHFPTREMLFEGCTSWGMRYATVPDLHLLANATDPEERTRLGVQQAYAFYESLLGQIWATYKYQDESPVLARTLKELERYIGQVTDVVMNGWEDRLSRDVEARSLVTGLLSFLTYYALREEGGLSPQQAADHIAEAVLDSFNTLTLKGREEAANAERQLPR
jgi:AcrR family transcriptional regulator